MKFFGRKLTILAAGLLLAGGCKSSPPVPAPVAVKPATRPTMVASVAPATMRSVDAFPSTTDPRETVPFLASDALAGRLPGSPGIQRAGDFLAAELSRIGLKPLPGQADYFQPFDMAQASTLSPATEFLVNGQGELPDRDFEPMGLSAEGAFHGPVIFAGFGITTDPTEPVQYDDYAGLDVRGKVVLAMMKEPAVAQLDAHGKPAIDNDHNPIMLSRLLGNHEGWSNNAMWVSKARNAARHGAAALLLVAPLTDGGPDVVPRYDGDSKHLAAIPVIRITRRMANVILSMGGTADLKSQQDAIDTSFQPRSGDLKDIEVSGAVAVQHKHIPVRNVIAYLPGAGSHADEWVVVGAHYDHLGLGQLGHTAGRPTSGVWHGADDNASGTAAVLALADRLKHSKPLPRSVLFIFFTAEEEGLVGSDHFVKNPLIPMEKIVAMLNLDMVGRLKNESLAIGGGGTAAIFDSMVASAIRGTNLTTTFALPEDGGRGGLGPSDHMSFAERKIPVLFLFTGMHADYHRPTDTADKINYEGIDEVVGVSQRIVQQMAAMPRQQYDASSDSNSMTRSAGGKQTRRAVLGVVPDDSAMDVSNGVPISGIVTGGPADKAGFKANDLLVMFNGKPLRTLSDLSEALDESHAGDSVEVKVLRDSKPVVLHAVLEER